MTGGVGTACLLRQTLESSFSAVSTPIFATKYSFCRVFQDLQDLQSFAPLRSQNFSKKVVPILSFLNKVEWFIQFKFHENALKLVFFFEILMKFCRNFTNMLRMSRIFNFLKKKDQNFRKIRENFGNVQIIQKIIQHYSVVSLVMTCTKGRGAGGAGFRRFISTKEQLTEHVQR